MGFGLAAVLGSLLPLLSVNAATLGECRSLYGLYQAFGGGDWRDNAGWPDHSSDVTADCCSWSHVTCNTGSTGVPGAVVKVNPGHNFLSGPAIPPRLFQGLPYLEEVILMGNQISGPIPPDLFRSLTLLRVVKLNNNQLHGPLPEDLFSGLEKLNEVSLSQNRLSGPIPEKLFHDLEELQKVSLWDNELGGDIPESLFSTLPKLSVVWLQKNKLTGQLPEKLFQDLTSLTQVWLSSNMLQGSWPESVFSFSPGLKEVSMSQNLLHGAVPEHLCASVLFLDYDTEHSCCPSTRPDESEQACPSLNQCCSSGKQCLGTGYCCNAGSEGLDAFGQCSLCLFEVCPRDGLCCPEGCSASGLCSVEDAPTLPPPSLDEASEVPELPGRVPDEQVDPIDPIDQRDPSGIREGPSGIQVDEGRSGIREDPSDAAWWARPGVGMLVGIVAGLVALALLVACGVCMWRSRARRARGVRMSDAEGGVAVVEMQGKELAVAAEAEAEATPIAGDGFAFPATTVLV